MASTTGAGVSRRTTRAAPLSPPERRSAIIAAALPLLRTHGLAVTTKQIAAAAGVAEGTIFSVFPDKDTLLTEALESAFDTQPTTDRLAAIDRSLPLTDRLIAAVEVLQGYLTDMWQLMSTIGRDRMIKMVAGGRSGPIDPKVFVPLFEPDASCLRRDPLAAAQALLGLVLASSNPMVVGDQPKPAAEVVDLLLDGIRQR